MRRFCVLMFLTSALGLAYAETNAVRSVNYLSATSIGIEFKNVLGVAPKNFVISSNKIVIDLEDTASEVPRTTKLPSATVIVVTSQERTRIIISLDREVKYALKTKDASLVIELDDAQPIITSTTTPEALITIIRDIVKSEINLKDSIEHINSLLLMPPNEFTEEAQETAGIVYERLNQPEKAKAEYRAFISMYPESARVARVRQHLIALEIALPVTIADKSEARKPKQGKDSSIDGSISEYLYYSGTSLNGAPVQTDQEVALTNFRLTGKWQENENVSKVVIRNTTLTNIFQSGMDKNNLSVAYYDYENTFADYSLRVGRQMPLMGILGRFDGVVATSNIGNESRIKAAIGQPYVMSSKSERQMSGIALEKFYDNGWSSTYYFNYQTADGFPERAAFGTESFYFKNGNAMTVMAEYDLLYQAVNSIMIHASTEIGEYSSYALIDVRKSPVLYGERALMLGYSSPQLKAYDTVGDAVSRSNYSAGSIYNFINQSTPYSNAFVVGASKQLNTKWNLNSNIQISNMTETSDPSFIPSIDMPQSVIQTPSTGNIYGLNFQLFGNDVRSKGNTIMVVLSFSEDKISNGQTLTLLDGETFDGFRLDNQISMTQRVQGTIKTFTTNLSIKMNYKLGLSSSIESQIGLAKTNVDTGFYSSESINQMFFVGLKYDF